MDLEFGNYYVMGSPQFVPANDDPNAVVFDFQIERKNLNKSWATSQTHFTGSLRISLGDAGRINITSVYTSEETREVTRSVFESINRHFRSSGIIPSGSEVQGVVFSAFDNESRISFLKNLTESREDGPLKFVDMVDIEFRPDGKSTLPSSMQWMQDKIRELRLGGQSLHQTSYLRDHSNHRFIELFRIDARFIFSFGKAEGECVLSLGFPGSQNDPSSEMETNVESVALNLACRHMDKDEIRRMILAEMEESTIRLFGKKVSFQKSAGLDSRTISSQTIASMPIAIVAP